MDPNDALIVILQKRRRFANGLNSIIPIVMDCLLFVGVELRNEATILYRTLIILCAFALQYIALVVSDSYNIYL